MAQFRTTADIQNEVLQKAGETTGGNSPFETIAMTYLNKVHHAIVAGGSIFNIDVDEPWTWARSKHPIVLELLAPYTTGTITCTVNDVNITFSSAPSVSLEGWHIQVSGKPTVYRITKHTAADTSAQIDSSFVNDTGAYNFRAFKIDYEIMPTYMYVDNSNDRLDFKGTAASTFTASLTHGAYTPANLIAHALTQLNAGSTVSWTGAYDTVARTFNMTANVASVLYGASGSNKHRSAMRLLGLDATDQTASSFTSAYTPNAVSRLIEPLKIFISSCDEPFIRSTDPIKMQEDYPISMIEQRTPDRFCRIEEDTAGRLVIRFNAYPQFKMKVQVDWIPVPRDLQDNAASFPLLPRGDIDVLIHGAAAYIAFDKEDTKFDAFLKLVGSGLQAMQKKNRSLLNRTGENFAGIVPRTDYTKTHKVLRYGYTVSGSTAASTTAESVQSMIAVTISYTSFQTASTASSVTARTLPANRTLFALIAKHSTSFTGSGITSVSLNVGIAGDLTKFINGFSINQATAASAQDSSLVLYYPAADTAIVAQAISVGGNLSALSGGSLVLYFQETITG